MTKSYTVLRLVLLRLVLLFFYIAIFKFHGLGQTGNAPACIGKIMQQHHVMGLSVAVVKKKKIIYTHSFGLKDAATKTPMTNDCLFRIASISKSFSATSILQLVEAKNFPSMTISAIYSVLKSEIQSTRKPWLRFVWHYHTSHPSMTARAISHSMLSILQKTVIGQNVIMTTRRGRDTCTAISTTIWSAPL